MKSKLIKGSVFALIIIVGFGLKAAIESAEVEAEEKEAVDTRPTVSVESLIPISHDVQITSFGEVMPLEETELAAQVSGMVTNWNTNFVAGGLVERGEVLFEIEKDRYEAAVLQAEAQVSLAEASLIEELARQKVAKRESRNLPQNQVSDLYLRKPQVLSAQAQLKSAQASLRMAKKDLDNTQVKAPYDALVVSRNIGSGTFVNVGMQVAKLNNIESAEIIFPVAGFDSPFLPQDIDNNPAVVTTRGQVETQRKAYLQRDLGIVDENTRMSHLVVRVDDPYSLNSEEPALKFGSYVEVTFVGKRLENVFKVPQSLVNKRKIWLVDAEDKLVAHHVEVIREEGEHFFISSGVEAEDRMVKTLPEYPQNGMPVKIMDAPVSLAARAY
ncbi:efflux RND transporter periplasmic adaptor subunit [Glaciecola sp. KUL10]|uniref:efflux RND transporter periplasmic adaptor subunit n=1 Tax=Glaciecola sp. (strain KUL10) TaxID=2161813 RepID=UPI000D786664|nr:efflux RND transporter periplasmic adaptor subunit [Glaciecola sp. KUL10]GBL05919.1 multidrug resistance protein [Glaciecola sp. KUL10]